VVDRNDGYKVPGVLGFNFWLVGIILLSPVSTQAEYLLQWSVEYFIHNLLFLHQNNEQIGLK